MSLTKVFLLDDRIGFCDRVRDYLQTRDCQVDVVCSIAEAKIKVFSKKYDLYFLSLPDGDGSDLVKLIRDFGEAIIVILTNKKPTMNTLTNILSSEVSDYILQSEVEHRLAITLERVKEKKDLVKCDSLDFSYHAITIGESKSMDQVKHMINQFANSDINTIISGESGVGKELVAKAFNSHHRDRTRPFIPINLITIPDNLIESALFGHVKGAFTNADSETTGKLELADGGDLFLDEVEEIPMHIQPKLLRIIQSGEFCKLGSNKIIKVKIRFISATNRDLQVMIDEGKFRSDLFFRLAGIEVHVPPLRDRCEDIPFISNLILKNIHCEHLKLSSDALSYLMSQSWPGNVRELEQRLIVAAHIVLGSKETLVIERVDLTPNKIAHLSQLNSNQVERKFEFSKEGYHRVMVEAQKEYLKKLLDSVHGDISLAAMKISMSRSVMYTKLNELGIRR